MGSVPRIVVMPEYVGVRFGQRGTGSNCLAILEIACVQKMSIGKSGSAGVGKCRETYDPFAPRLVAKNGTG